MRIGKVLLERKDTDFKAGFCLIEEDLPELTRKIRLLHPSEMRYYASLKFDRRKKSYLLGRMVAKQAVLELLPNHQLPESFSIEFGIFNFPVVKHLQFQNFQVSISHCDNKGIALAFPEEHPLGIDLEKIDGNKVETMKTVMVANEYDALTKCSLNIELGSTMIWTIKEALSKVLKTGFTLDFRILEIQTLQKVGQCYESTFKFFSQYRAVSKKVGAYVFTIVLPKNTACDLNIFWNELIKSTDKNEQDFILKSN